jgi:hypothetical protein
MKWAAIFVFAAAAFAQDSATDVWKPLGFLVGEWTGEGGGGPGQGSGGFSFQFDLQHKVLVRKNFSEYPATKEKPAYRHDDLMIVYREAGALRAIYFDNEDHVIRYAIEPAADSVRFVSEATRGEPRYRMTYRNTGGGKAAFLFEIAPPDQPEAFAKYIEASLRRKQ